MCIGAMKEECFLLQAPPLHKIDVNHDMHRPLTGQRLAACRDQNRVRTEYYSAEDFGRIIFWFIWQNKLSGSKSYFSRNAEIPFFGRNSTVSAEIHLF